MHLQASTAALAKLDKEQATLAQSVINGDTDAKKKYLERICTRLNLWLLCKPVTSATVRWTMASSTGGAAAGCVI